MSFRIAAIGVVCLTVLAWMGRVAMGIAAPPKGENPVENVPVDQTQLGESKFHLVPPPGDTWVSVNKAGVQNVVAWTSKKKDAILAIQLLPADMVINDEVTKALVKQLRETRLKNKSKMYLEPTTEPDDRFALKVHERYEVKDGKVADQLHIYRYVGQRIAMATINAVCDDPVDVAAYHKLGEETLLSITGPGVKAPKAAATRPSTRPTTRPATRPATTRPPIIRPKGT